MKIEVTTRPAPHQLSMRVARPSWLQYWGTP